MLSIGEFSKICGVSTKTLRYYDETGLLRPEEVSPENGYRYYAITQLRTMLFINRLKAYRFSLEEIRDLLTEDPTEERLGEALRRKRREIQEMLDGVSLSLRQMQGDIKSIERGIPVMAYLEQIAVQLTETSPMNILTTRKIIDSEGYGENLGKLFARVAAEKLTPVGPPMAIYHSPDYDPQAHDTEFAIPVAEVVTGTRTLPGMLCAKSVHRGAYEGLNGVYARLRTWMEEEGYTLAYAPFEVYLSDPQQVKSPEELVTEVYFPVKKQ